MGRVYFFSKAIVSISFSFLGLIFSLFIAVVSYRACMKSHRLSSFDGILFSLGITRFLMLGFNLLGAIWGFVSGKVENSVHVPAVFLWCWMFLDFIDLSFVTLLNTLYCVKITNFQHYVFLLLKRNLPPKTSQLLLACVLVSALITLLYIVLRQTSSPFSGSVAESNGTEFDLTVDMLYLMTSLMWSSSLQFIINVTSASLLIDSLRRHIQKMQRSTTHFWNPQTEAHVGAMKLMIYFLVLYIPSFIATGLLYLPNERIGLEARILCVIISAFYHPGHSALIILTHPKLKTKAKKILCFSK